MIPNVVVDVGNSRIKWGRCYKDGVKEIVSLSWENPDTWLVQFYQWGLTTFHNWVVAGVNPARMYDFANWIGELGCKVVKLQTPNQIPIKAKVDFPEKVGVDRLLNALAVNQRRVKDQPAVVVDAGSAVTVDYVDEEGTFRGGAIFPGLRLMAQALNSYTAKLPLVEIKQKLEPPETSTERAMQLGIFHAVLGGIELLIRGLHQKFALPLQIFVGGGDGPLLAPHLPWPHIVWPEMTLQGIFHTMQTLEWQR